MSLKMSHDEWLEACGELAIIEWHLERQSLEIPMECLEKARIFLEESRNPSAASMELEELIKKVDADPELARRLQSLLHGESTAAIRTRLVDLIEQWLPYSSVAPLPYINGKHVQN